MHIAIVDVAGRAVIPFDIELNTGHLGDASDRTIGYSIESAICNTDATRRIVCNTGVKLNTRVSFK